MTQDKSVDLAGVESLAFGGGPDVEAFLSSALKDGLALSDDGFAYESVQDAVDAASGWVFVGPGTFNESVSSSKNGLTIQGCGDNTIIDGGDGDAIELTGNNCTVKDLKVNTDTSTGGIGLTVYQGDNNRMLNISTDGCGGPTLQGGTRSMGINCRMTNSRDGVDVVGPYGIYANNVIDNMSQDGIELANEQDNIVCNNQITNVVSMGVGEFSSGGDSLIGGNRIADASDTLYVNGTDSIVFNNRLSEWSDRDIEGGGYLADGNLSAGSN